MPAAAPAAEPLAAPVPAAAPGELCLPAVADAERVENLPPQLLRSIAFTESGRVDPATGRTVPWPWTINAAGTPYFFATKAEAVAGVQALQARGIRSIDVGCAQVSLLHHPTAFPSLEAAFDPATNTAYAARFLNVLRRATGSWPLATAGYHSQTAELGYAYARRVLAIWSGAGKYGDLPPLPPAAGTPVAGAPVQPLPNYDSYTPGFAAWLRRLDEDRARLLDRFGPVAQASKPVGRPGLRVRPVAHLGQHAPRQVFWASRMLRRARLVQVQGRGPRAGWNGGLGEPDAGSEAE